MAAIASLKAILTSTIRNKLPDATLAADTCNALDKLLYFDTELVFDTYIRSMLSEIEAAKDKAVKYAQNLEDKVLERTKALSELSRNDSLTGLLNKRAFVDEFRLSLARAKREHEPLTLLYIDVDNFKQINDTDGHSRGDMALKNSGSDPCRHRMRNRRLRQIWWRQVLHHAFEYR